MKSVLITGAGSGLGRGTAIGLAKAGHRVFATTQLWAQATDLRREVEKLGLSDTLSSTSWTFSTSVTSTTRCDGPSTRS